MRCFQGIEVSMQVVRKSSKQLWMVEWMLIYPENTRWIVDTSNSLDCLDVYGYMVWKVGIRQQLARQGKLRVLERSCCCWRTQYSNYTITWFSVRPVPLIHFTTMEKNDISLSRGNRIHLTAGNLTPILFYSWLTDDNDVSETSPHSATGEIDDLDASGDDDIPLSLIHISEPTRPY